MFAAGVVVPGIRWTTPGLLEKPKPKELLVKRFVAMKYASIKYEITTQRQGRNSRPI